MWHVRRRQRGHKTSESVCLAANCVFTFLLVCHVVKTACSQQARRILVKRRALGPLPTDTHSPGIAGALRAIHNAFVCAPCFQHSTGCHPRLTPASAIKLVCVCVCLRAQLSRRGLVVGALTEVAGGSLFHYIEDMPCATVWQSTQVQGVAASTQPPRTIYLVWGVGETFVMTCFGNSTCVVDMLGEALPSTQPQVWPF